MFVTGLRGRWSYGQKGVTLSDEKGLTVSFEYEGRHHASGRVGSIAGAVDKLTLVAARDKISGRFLTHSELLRFGEVYGVPVVERRKKLEGKSLAEVEKVIRREEGVEGGCGFRSTLQAEDKMVGAKESGW